MCLSVAYSLKMDPVVIYYNWYPNQLVSTYAFCINKEYSSHYAQIEDKDKGKVPEVMIAQMLSDQEYAKYKKTKIRQMDQILKTKNKEL